MVLRRQLLRRSFGDQSACKRFLYIKTNVFSEEMIENYRGTKDHFVKEARRLHKRALSKKKFVLNPQKMDEP